MLNTSSLLKGTIPTPCRNSRGELRSTWYGNPCYERTEDHSRLFQAFVGAVLRRGRKIDKRSLPSFFPVVFPGYVLTNSPQSERRVLLSERQEYAKKTMECTVSLCLFTLGGSPPIMVSEASCERTHERTPPLTFASPYAFHFRLTPQLRACSWAIVSCISQLSYGQFPNFPTQCFRACACRFCLQYHCGVAGAP